jgi:hypothetical protein
MAAEIRLRAIVATVAIAAGLSIDPAPLAAQSSLTLSVTPTTVAPGGTITVNVVGGPGNARDWLGLYSGYTLVDWKYLNGTRTAPLTGVSSAAVTFAMPSTPGTYSVQFLVNDTYTVAATSAPITVQATGPAPSISVNPTTVPGGGNVTVSIANGPGYPRDWLALYQGSTVVDWKYLNGTRTASATGVSSANVVFVMPTTPGTYTFRFLLNDTLTLLASSAPITVTPGSVMPSVVVSPTTAATGATLTVDVANGPGNVGDWIALYPSGGANTLYLDWQYLNGLKTVPASAVTCATVTFVLPTTPGRYNVRFFANYGFTLLATSADVTVGDVTPPAISGVASSSITGSAAAISWTTDEASDSQVDYGPTIAYASSTAVNASMVTSHVITLTGLVDATQYHYRVRSRDAAGNAAVSTDFTFSTPDGTAPAVAITAPAAGATVSGTVTVSANATDNVAVAGVQFKLDGVNLGAEDTTAPYAASWNASTASNGPHTLTAVARDGAGNVRTSAAVTVTVSNDVTGPVISAVASSNVTTSGATITWTTDEASDSQVDYGTTTAYGSSSVVNTSTVTSHAVALSGLVSTATYHFRVRSRDVAGNQAISGDFIFTTLDGVAPTVAITAPSAGASLAGTVTLAASATDNVGVVGVQFNVDGAALGAEDLAPPYSASWSTLGVANGSHTLTATARDAAGNVGTSSAVAVTVSNTTVAQVALTWDPNTEPDLAGYKLYVGTASGVYTTTIDVGNMTTHTVAGLQPGATYYFVVTAYNTSGLESGFSNEVSAAK